MGRLHRVAPSVGMHHCSRPHPHPAQHPHAHPRPVRHGLRRQHGGGARARRSGPSDGPERTGGPQGARNTCLVSQLHVLPVAGLFRAQPRCQRGANSALADTLLRRAEREGFARLCPDLVVEPSMSSSTQADFRAVSRGPEGSGG
jgi:hypothetical protein